LADGEDIAIMQRQVCSRVAVHGGNELDVYVPSNGLRTMTFGIARKVGSLRVRGFLEATGYTDQILDMHVGRKRIAAGLGHFAFHIDRRWVNFCCVPMNDEPVARLKRNVVCGISGQSPAQVHTEDLHCSVKLGAEELRGIERSILGDAARKKHGILQPHLSGSAVLAWNANFSADPDFGGGLKVVTA